MDATGHWISDVVVDKRIELERYSREVNEQVASGVEYADPSDFRWSLEQGAYSEELHVFSACRCKILRQCEIDEDGSIIDIIIGIKGRDPTPNS